MNHPARIWLLVSVLLPYVLDVVLTLVGQSSLYWSGAYGQVTEGNPVAAWLLASHPVWFVAGTAGWAVLFCLGLWRGPLRLAIPLGFVLAFAHGLGAGSWLVDKGWPGMAAAVFLLLIVDRSLTRSWRALHVQPVLRTPTGEGRGATSTSRGG